MLYIFFSTNYKNKKLALIAVCNKLLKQIFGIVKTAVLPKPMQNKKNEMKIKIYLRLLKKISLKNLCRLRTVAQ
jgi:hypothetical protein